jgi:protein-disulfide isomerase
VVQATPAPAVVAGVSVDDDPSIGPDDAPGTIVMFTDYQCPYCKRFRDVTLDTILSTYEGKVKYVQRDWPLPATMHPNAQKAAEATECADDQGKFWEYQGLLFANQSAIDVASLKSYAAQLGLDTATFNQCLDGGAKTAEVQKDQQDGTSYGVQGTPTFFINGRMVSGAIPFTDYQDSSGVTQPGFKSIIEQALEQAEAS